MEIVEPETKASVTVAFNGNVAELPEMSEVYEIPVPLKEPKDLTAEAMNLTKDSAENSNT
jgi:hypothetical protein